MVVLYHKKRADRLPRRGRRKSDYLSSNDLSLGVTIQDIKSIVSQRRVHLYASKISWVFCEAFYGRFVLYLPTALLAHQFGHFQPDICEKFLIASQRSCCVRCEGPVLFLDYTGDGLGRLAIPNNSFALFVTVMLDIVGGGFRHCTWRGSWSIIVFRECELGFMGSPL